MAKLKLLKFNSCLKRLIILLSAISISLWLSDLLFPLKLDSYQQTSVLVYGDNQTLAHVFLTPDEKFRILTQPNQVPSLYIQTLLAREDSQFYQHFGVNPFSVLRALYQNLRFQTIISGGSTLTMQTARLLEPRKRTFFSKVIESFRALQLEWHFTKQEILSIYLTLAPFGSNIEGVSAAAYAYFNKTPQTLATPEIALLVAMVQSPNRLRSDLYPIKAKLARNRILDLMKSKALINQQEHDLHIHAPLPTVIQRFPREIPHLAWRLKQQYPKQQEIHVSIDLRLQKQIELLLAQYELFLPTDANAAILVLDHLQNKPIVYIGSTHFMNRTNHGFIDYIRAYRSPGSTLKPFIYGIGFDSGLIQPDSFVLDIRRRFGSYYPHNFDRDIHGMVQVNEALALSLNIPAVSLLNEIGVVRFISFLKSADIHPKYPQSGEPGLSSALGGLGMTLEQLVLLYSGLGHQGMIRPFFYVESMKTDKESYLMSSRAAQSLKEILTVETSQGRSIAIKTGTSYGHRDVLAIGVDKQYVIGIWAGLANNAPMRGETGASTAVPLLLKVHQLLPKNKLKTVAIPSLPEALMLKKNRSSAESAISSAGKLALLFPVDNSVLHFDNQKAIPCYLQGGVKPYTWLIDGQPVSIQSWQQKYFWQAKNPGFYRISVIDAVGETMSVKIELI